MILNNRSVSIDTETTTKALLGRKASPYHPDNWVVAAGYSVASKDEPQVVAAYFHGKQDAHGWLAQLLTGHAPKWLAGFNIKFDILHLLKSETDYAAWQDWVAAGGLVWDCQLAEYLLGGMAQEHHTLSLEEVSLRYGGTLKLDAVKDLWNAGVDTPDIPYDTLMEYLCGSRWLRSRGGAPFLPSEHDVEGDVPSTERIFKGQYAAAMKRKMLPLMRINMGALLATIEMERNGLACSKKRGMALAARLERDVAATRKKLVAMALPPDLPWEFNWGSPKQLSALIFGGEVTYPKREYKLGKPYGTFAAGEYVFPDAFATGDRWKDYVEYASKEETHYLLVDGTTQECLWWEHCLNTQWQGEAPAGKERVLFVSGKNAGLPKTKKVKSPDLTKPKSRMGEDTWTFPRQYTPKPAWAGADPAVYSTASDVIEEVAETSDLPWLQELGKLSKMTKDLGTYYLTVDGNGKEKGMLTKVGEDGIIHHSIHMVRTVTARFSSSDPNLQNVPRGDTSNVKRMFRSRYPGGYIIPSDFKSLEIYCQAYLTGDRQLIADLKDNLDMHCARLSTVENKPYPEVLALCKGKDAVPEWGVKRTLIKTFSFQRAYGAGAAKIAAYLKVSPEQVEEWIKADEARYPEIPLWQSHVAAQIGQTAIPLDRWGTHPTVGVRFQVHRGFYTDFLHKTYCFDESASPDFMAKPRRKDQAPVYASFSPTEAKNYPVQGLGGEVMKAALWLALRGFYAVKNFQGKAILVNTVHDASYVDAAPSVAANAAALLHGAMEEACALIEQEFSITLPLPVPADTHWGHSMFIEKSIPGLDEKALAARLWLRRNFLNNFKPSWEN